MKGKDEILVIEIRIERDRLRHHSLGLLGCRFSKLKKMTQS